MDTENVRPLTQAGLAEVLASLNRYWDDRDVAALHHPWWLDEYPDESFVIRIGGEIAAYLIAAEGRRRGETYIHLVGTRGDYRRQGLGRRLYQHVEQRARSLGRQQLRAITTPTNLASLAFHRSLGWDYPTAGDDATRPIAQSDYSGPGHDRVVLTKRFPAPRIADLQDRLSFAPECASLDLLYRLGDEHLDEVVRLFGREWWTNTRSREDARRALRETAVHVGLQEPSTGRLAAMARIVTDGEYYGYLADVIVDPTWRGKGVSRILVWAAMHHPRTRNAEKIELACIPDKIPLYERFGFASRHPAFAHMIFRPGTGELAPALDTFGPQAQ